MIANKLPDSLPDKIKMSYFENQKKEWKRVVDISEEGLTEEKQAEIILHWKKINDDAKERIKEIDRNLMLLKP